MKTMKIFSRRIAALLLVVTVGITALAPAASGARPVREAAVAAGLFNDVIAASAALPLPPPESWQPVLARIKDLPLWLAHGRADETVPVLCAVDGSALA